MASPLCHHLTCLYTSDAELAQRVSVEALGLFIKTALASSEAWYSEQTFSGPAPRALVVVLGPGHQIRLIMDEHNAILQGEALALVSAWTTSARNCEVAGPVVLGVQYSLGAAPPGFPVPWPPPPAKWIAAAQACGGADSTVDDVALYFLSQNQTAIQ